MIGGLVGVGGLRGREAVLGLRVPAGDDESVALVVVKRSSVAFSDQIGGGVLEEWHGVACGVGFTFYLDEHRVAKGLRLNDRAAVLSARLGEVDRGWLAGLRGDLLVLGCDEGRDDADVPAVLVDAAWRSGLTPAGAGVWL